MTIDPKTTSLAACLAGLLGAAATAQTPFVIPAGANLATTEAPSYAQDLGRYAPLRSQYVYAARVMPAAPLQISGVRARPDAGRGFAGGHSFEIEAWMSSQGRDPAAGYSYGFAGNRGPDFAQVMNKKRISFPASTVARPEPFGVVFPLDAPFVYRAGAFVFEVRVHGTSFDFADYHLDAVHAPGLVRPAALPQDAVGTGCPADLRIWTNREGRSTGGLLYTQGYTGLPGKSVQVLDFMGLSTKQFGATPLPLDLASFGAPGCRLYNDIRVTATALSSATATDGHAVTLWGPVPFVPALVGATVYNQWVVLDPTFNAAGARVSSSVKTVLSSGAFQGAPDCLHVFSYGRAGGHVFDGEEGAARWADGRGLVLELR